MAAFENLTPGTFDEKMKADDNAFLLDVRTPGEYAEKHIPGSTMIDINSADFFDKIEELDKNKNYYVYCRSGGRSARACQAMSEAGFEGKLFNLEGGITAWKGETKSGS